MLTTIQLENDILNGNFNDIFLKLYGETDLSEKRYIKILNSFKNTFGASGEIFLFSSPGRTEIIGNHTDHQCGRAIGASVNLDIVGIVRLRDDDIIRIKSEGFDFTDEISVEDIEIYENEYNTSKALIRGCVAKFIKLGYKLSGFDMYTSSNVLKGSGLSSSAAFEVLVATVINEMFCDGKEDKVSIAKIGKYAENVYFNKPCGLLDQLSSSVGGFTYIDFKNLENPEIKRLEFNIKEYGYSLCVVDTGGNHAGLTNEYKGISDDLKNISSYFSKEVLREVSEEEFYNEITNLRNKISDRAVMRAIHVFNENKRVDEFYKALENKEFNKILALVKESGNSSFKYLKNVYSSDAKEQGIAMGLCMSERILGNKGVARVHGGGFAGTIQAYVPCDMADYYKKEMEKIFGEGKCYNLFIRSSGGLKII